MPSGAKVKVIHHLTHSPKKEYEKKSVNYMIRHRSMDGCILCIFYIRVRFMI